MFNCCSLSLLGVLMIWPGPGLIHPTARDPLPAPYFTIDATSPTTLLGFLPGDVLSAPGPEIAIAAVNLGLFDTADDLDALSFDNALASSDETFVLVFSVDRGASGNVAPDPVLVARGQPFNVQDQAAKHQASGDAYMSLLLFDRSGPIPPSPLLGSHSNNNTLVINQGDAGGVDFSLKPAGSPTTTYPPGQPRDNVNGGASSGGSSLSPRVELDYIFFSLTAGSPSLITLPGTGSGADIYIDNNTAIPGGEQLYAAPYLLGLMAEDDIDALIVFDDGDHIFTFGLDQVIFSLAPGSPSLDGFFSSGDLFTSHGGGVFDLYAEGSQIGLAFGDNLNMVDYALCLDVLDCAYDWAIGFFRPLPQSLEAGLRVYPQ
ncbi:MAG: hypothetical protein KKB50_10275 [Planctomycetes bacterium]|nr:hypothetical protein [Planctomycetota bacterium]